MNIKVKKTKTSRKDAILKVEQINVQNELNAQADKALIRARALAPVLSGDLRSNGRVERIKNGARVIFGDSRVPYARRRHFENRKNPHTKNYLKRAGDTTVKDGFIILKKGLK